MKTCGDCIHADLCEKDIALPEFSRRSPAYCEGFKDKADFVEVVRCKECKYFAGVSGIVGWCTDMDVAKSEKGYCDHGERRDNDAT